MQPPVQQLKQNENTARHPEQATRSALYMWKEQEHETAPGGLLKSQYTNTRGARNTGLAKGMQPPVRQLLHSSPVQ
jgi:hypothetical protein